MHHARDGSDAVVLDEAPLPMPALRPRIGIDELDAGERARRQPAKHLGGIPVVEADVGEMLRGNGRERLGHAVDERLDADEAGVRMRPCLAHQVLAAAETDLEPYVIDRSWEERAKLGC